jgi:hypothetical protein
MPAPLPWSVALDSDVPDAGSVLVVDANGEVVCDVGILGREREENERHAHAIAALITTLEGARAAMQRVLDGRGFDTLDELAGECLQSQVDVATAVIARVTGAPRRMVGRVDHGSLVERMEDTNRPGREKPAEGAEGRGDRPNALRPGLQLQSAVE